LQVVDGQTAGQDQDAFVTMAGKIDSERYGGGKQPIKYQ